MSSCGNPGENDTLMPRRLKFDKKTKICVKCKERDGNIVIRHAVYCKLCFLSLVQARFKRVLEPTINDSPDGQRRKALSAAGSLVIGFSGETCSTAMLNLVARTYFAPRPVDEESLKGGINHPRNTVQRVWNGRPAVCYVEVCGAENDRIEEIRAAVKKLPGSPFDFIPLRLEDSFDPAWWTAVGGNFQTSHLQLSSMHEDLSLSDPSPNSPIDLGRTPLERLNSYLSALPTQTAVHNAIQTLTRVLLLHTAVSRQASHLLLGTSLTSLSVNLVSGIAQGSGFAIVQETQEEWVPRPQKGISVRVVRPMRDIGMKDCAIWNWWNGLCPVHRSMSDPRVGRTAIDTLTRDFIFGLETDYPSTVSTIARTCAKLTAKEDFGTVCILCERPAQRDIQKWKSQISIRSYPVTSSEVSGNFRPSHLSEDDISYLIKDCSTCSGSETHSLAPYLCYACHTTLTSRSSRTVATTLRDAITVPLPIWVESSLSSNFPRNVDNDHVMHTRKQSRLEMRSQIEDFLVPDVS